MFISRLRALAAAGVASLAALSLGVLPTTAAWTGAVTFAGTVQVAPQTEEGDLVIQPLGTIQLTQQSEGSAQWLVTGTDGHTVNLNMRVPSGLPLYSVQVVRHGPAATSLTFKTGGFHAEVSGDEGWNWTAAVNVHYVGTVPLTPNPFSFELTISADVGRGSENPSATVNGQLQFVPYGSVAAPSADVAEGENAVVEDAGHGTGEAEQGTDEINEDTVLQIAVADGGESEREFSMDLSDVTADLAPETTDGPADASGAHATTIDLYAKGTRLRDDSELTVEATSDGVPVLAEIVPGEDGVLSKVEGQEFFRVTVRVEVPPYAGITDPADLPLSLRLTATTPLESEPDVWSAYATVSGTLSHPGVEIVEDANGEAEDTQLGETEGGETGSDGDELVNNEPAPDETPAADETPAIQNEAPESAEPEDATDDVEPPIVDQPAPAPPVVESEPAPEVAPEPTPEPAAPAPAPEAAPEPKPEPEPTPEPAESEPETAVVHDCDDCENCATGTCTDCDDPSCPARESEPAAAATTDKTEEVDA